MATKIQASCYALCLLASVLINLLLITNLYVGSDGGKWRKVIEEDAFGYDHDELSWSRKAAAEAEAVAAVPCSGHGRAYLDGSIVNGTHVCECNTCYGGPDCSILPSPSCAVNADSGDPLFLEPFWMQHAASSAILVPGWHRMSYQFNENAPFSIELEKYIRKLHTIAGNAVTAGRYIVFGVGSTQLLSAAVYALSAENNSTSLARVVASIPFYSVCNSTLTYKQCYIHQDKCNKSAQELNRRILIAIISSSDRVPQKFKSSHIKPARLLCSFGSLLLVNVALFLA